MGIQWRVLKMNIWSPYVIQKVLNNEFFLQEKLSTGHGAKVTCYLLRYCLCRMMSSSFSLNKPWDINSWLQHIFPCSWEARGQGPWNAWIYGWCTIFFLLKMGLELYQHSAEVEIPKMSSWQVSSSIINSSWFFAVHINGSVEGLSRSILFSLLSFFNLVFFTWSIFSIKYCDH